jgi:transposase
MRKTAKALNISIASLSRWSKSISPKERKRSKVKLSDAMIVYIQQLVTSNPSFKCIDLVSKVNKEFNVNISRQLVHLILKRLGFSFKRLKKRGKSNCKEELKKLFISRMVNLPKDVTIVSIDESGFDQRVAPIYGYSLKGKQAIMEYQTSNDRHHYSLLMAIGSNGTQHYIINKGSINSQCFLEFIKTLDLTKGTILLMDNASIHKSKSLQEYTTSKGFVICFTPPYSPEFNPIEMVFGMVKNDYYKLRYQSNFVIEKAIATSVSKVTKSNIINCFEHVHSDIAKLYKEV